MRYFLLILTMLAMAAYDFYTPADEANLYARATAGMGFIILAGYLTGKLLKQIGLPNLTGYLLAGCVCGPQVLDLVSMDVRESLSLIDELALAFIAFHAGGEMNYNWLRARAKQLVSMLGFGVGAVFIGVTTIMFFVMSQFNLLESATSWQELLAASIVFGAMATGMSPATTIAIILESKAKGVLADTVMAITVAADLVIIVLFTLTLNVVKTMLDPESSEGWGHALYEIGWEVGGSFGAGALLGFIMILYLRFMGQSVFLFLLGLSVVLIQFSHSVHLSLLLICMVAGFVVNNFSSEGHSLIEGIERGSVGVYIIFFTLAGVSLDFNILFEVWHVAVIYCLVRAFFFIGGSYLGARSAGAEPVIARWAWTGFLGQAGVSLGMLVLISKKLPYFESQLTAVLMSSIILDQIIGPVLFSKTLSWVGEAESQSS